MPNNSKIAAIVSWIAGIVTGLIALVFPLGYLFTSYQHLSGGVETEVRLIANSITQEVISNNPELWQFGQTRLEEYLSSSRHYSQTETRRVLNVENELIAVVTGSQVRPPLLRRSYPLADSGVVVGRVEISLSLLPVLRQAGLIALLALSVGAVAFMILRILPIRAIRRMEEALRKANEELELKVLERTAKLDEANREMRESRQYLLDIIQFFPDATMIIDSEGKVTAWNHAMEEFSGVKATEMLGRGDHEYALPFYGERRPILIDLAVQTGEELEGKYAHLERHGSTITGEAYIHNARGEKLYFHGTASALRNSEGQIIGAIESVRDISVRKRMDEAIREKEEQLQTITDTARDAIIMIDYESRISFWNPAAESIFGYSSAEAQGKELHDLLAPQKYMQAHREAFAAFRETGQGMAVGKTLELSAIRKGGEEFPVELSLSALQIKEKWHAVGVLRDVSARKKTEQEAQRRGKLVEKLNATLIDLAQDNKIYGGDTDVAFRTITEASALALATERVSIWFYSEGNDAVTCMDLYDTGSGNHSKGARLVASAYPAYFKTLNEEYIIAADDAVTDPRTKEFSESYLKPLGITSMLDVPIRLRGRVIGVFCHEHVGPPRKWSVEEQNFITAITGFTSLALEIFERIKTEDELRLSRTRFQNLVETTSDIVWEMNEESRYTFVSDRFFEVLGYKPEEVYGKSPLDLMPADEAERVAGIISELSASPKPFSFIENVSLDKNGNRVFLESCGVPIYHADGTFHGYSGIDRNITERKLAEEEIRQLNSELEQRVARRTRQLIETQEELVRKEKMAILGQLSGSVGHELRNPLGVMSNAVYFLKMVTADADETIGEYLDIIKHEIDNSLRIITDLLDFARTRTPQTKTTSVQELMNKSLAASVIPDSVTLQTDLPDNLPLLKVDPLQMEQVFQNLITNAVQALPDGGFVRISARLVNDVATGGDFVAVSIEDTGEGITPENMKKLFQPLFTTKAKGIGLGLVICRSLTEANGGRIEAKTESGRGATFTVYLATGA